MGKADEGLQRKASTLMQQAKFEINANAQGALAAFQQVKRASHDLSKEINSGLRDTVAGVFAIGAIKEAATATIEFAEGIEKASNRIGDTTENVQALKLAAREAGTSLGTMEKAL